MPTLKKLRADKLTKHVVFVCVDYDEDEQFLRRYRVPKQSTILDFKDKREAGRAIAETDRARLRAAVLNAI